VTHDTSALWSWRVKSHKCLYGNWLEAVLFSHTPTVYRFRRHWLIHWGCMDCRHDPCVLFFQRQPSGTHSPKNLCLCLSEGRKSYSFGMAWVWVHHMYTIPLIRSVLSVILMRLPLIMCTNQCNDAALDPLSAYTDMNSIFVRLCWMPCHWPAEQNKCDKAVNRSYGHNLAVRVHIMQEIVRHINQIKHLILRRMHKSFPAVTERQQ